MSLFSDPNKLPPPPPPSPIPKQALGGMYADEQPLSLSSIFKEANGQYSYARVFGAILTIAGLLAILFSPAIPQYKDVGYALIGLGYGGKILQKPFEK